MRMFDGMVRTLSDVRHVLGLKKNHISLGMMCVFYILFSPPLHSHNISRVFCSIFYGFFYASLECLFPIYFVGTKLYLC